MVCKFVVVVSLKYIDIIHYVMISVHIGLNQILRHW